jgi:hypothetical protein
MATKKKGGSAEPRVIKTDRHGFVRCRVCGCTEIDACANGCGWVDEDLCITCNNAVLAVGDWMENARRPTWAGLRREVDRLLQLGRGRAMAARSGGGHGRE